MGKNMRQLLKNQLKNVCVIIVCFTLLGLFIFPGCAAKQEQKKQDPGTAVSGKTGNDTKADKKIVKKQTKNNRIINKVELVQKQKSVQVIIKGNKELKYTSIKQAFPFGIAIYLPDTTLDEKITSIVSDKGSVSNIIPSYADKEKNTAKIEILLNQDLPYSIKKQGSSLKVSIAGGTGKITKNDKPKVKNSNNKKSLSSKKVIIPKSMANVSDIEFNVEDEGYTELTITTSHPVRYDFSKGKKGILYLNLYRTNIPRRHRRPFETKYFKSAVYKILPLKKVRKSRNSKIEISMREKVPYHVIQDNNVLTIRFEPSSIEPPKFTKADKSASERVINNEDISSDNDLTDNNLTRENTLNKNKAANSSSDEKNKKIARTNFTPAKGSRVKTSPSVKRSTAMGTTTKREPQRYEEPSLYQKKYTGEKIKLDFYETDIKNVFRILSSISNKNFAIDKNVTGSVTLTLDNPIPWDQVLDLVLAMNQLDKTEQGNVIRIATRATLAQEATQQQAKYKAMQKAREAQQSFQPMETEYIPINYADAASDIMPHIQKILTPKRGSVTVDKRTNMIIITDTKEKIIKARELIYTLDNVTPQIMISAKIVEANKNFSRNLGLGANFGFNEGATTAPGDQYEVSLNAPAAAPKQAMSFTFNHLVDQAFGVRDGGLSYLTTTLNAAESKGDVEVISSPKILTLDNIKATIKQGVEFPYNINDGDGNTTTAYKNIDLLLEVTPHVTPDRRISLEIHLTKNEIATMSTGSAAPALATNETTTTLLVNNNDTVVIGGVLKSKKTKTKKGFPYLMNIPLLGRLIRTDLNTADKQELLIFITPTIVQLKQRRNGLDISNQTLD